MVRSPVDNELSAIVWRNKYRYCPRPGEDCERDIRETWQRVAAAVASVEQAEPAVWQRRFGEIMEDFLFLPAGRILAGAGTRRRVTLFNCFVTDYIDDSLPGIFTRLREAAITMQYGGGIGCDFSTLRPRGSPARSAGTRASGPVSFMRMWDTMCATLLSTGARRGAMMATLRCDHPDIEEFIDAKRTPGELTNFNLSVQVTDAFLAAVDADEDWPLVFPDEHAPLSKPIRWPGFDGPVNCATRRVVKARDLWDRLIDAAYHTAEPGILLIDRINRRNNLAYCEQISATNPCGEIPLPPNGACNLGSINLARCVERPFENEAVLNLDKIRTVARHATRFLDNVIDLSEFPLPAQAAMARSTRRIGLGITGVADALILLGLRYDAGEGRRAMAEALSVIRDAAYGASIELAREKGSFPLFERQAFLDGEYARSLPPEIRDGIARHGLRNSHLIAIAPAGSISVLAGNVSSGIEPVYAARMHRRMLDDKGKFVEHDAMSFAYQLWRNRQGDQAEFPPAFVSALDLASEAHLAMVAALQTFVDNSISKTVNVPETISRAEFAGIYERAIALGLNGCTVFRISPGARAILSADDAMRGACCAPHREGD